MDANKLKKMEEVVRIGGRGTVRRKHKNIPSSAAVEEKRLQTTLGKLPLSQVNGIQEVTIEFTDSSEMVVSMPRVQGTTSSNLFVITGDFVRKSSSAGGPSKVAKASKPVAGSVCKSESQEGIKVVAKKPKKPRNRLRSRNKKAQMLLAAKKEEASELKNDPMAGGDSEPKQSVAAESIQSSSEDGDDPNDGKESSDGSDVAETIVGDADSLGSFDEWDNLSFYDDDYDSQAEQPDPETTDAQVSEDED
ncbi:transcription factor BTF3 homolog 4 [Drosophila yakuba]|uniref:Transcription factor BTF3 n=1 Tax=Drosophila yakuba TaxID=7245 RepID=B4Q2T2_DROYA|nr:transcription factor BTF3 homolog 4 [Drosophila yakuba]EDX01676.1 uncharacterized protein Dyak_GE17140 [Drosophila yakuba]